MTALVDAAINYYGKPWQTRLTIETLLGHSGQHVDKVYLVEEPRQPREDESIATVTDGFGDRVIVLRSAHYLGYWSLRPRWKLGREDVRLSVRYQQPLEITDKKYVFLSHNDVEYTADLVGMLLEAIHTGPHAGAGLIGQCWNCPAHTAGVCDSDRVGELHLSYAKTLRLVASVRSPRTRWWMIEPWAPLPLPECRLNESSCLLDVQRYRRHTVPNGTAPPIGMATRRTDTGCAWYRSMLRRGETFVNVHVDEYSLHLGGHPALFDSRLYDEREAEARAKVLDLGHPTSQKDTE